MKSMYILEGKTPVPEDDPIKWAKAFETSNRILQKDVVGDLRVSTIFLGLDHSFMSGPPILFETMVFPKDSYSEEYVERYETYDEAMEGHLRVVEFIRANHSVPPSPSEKESVDK